MASVSPSSRIVATRSSVRSVSSPGRGLATTIASSDTPFSLSRDLTAYLSEGKAWSSMRIFLRPPAGL